MTIEKRVDAYSFRSPLSLEEMMAKLNELGPWTWDTRDNDRFGEYIWAGVLRDGGDFGRVKIFVEPDQYAVDIVIESATHEKLDAVYDTLFAHLLPGIGATDLADTEHYE